jgi:prepilin-type N-terminal cleavage/methylation domain-containing protein
MRFTLFKAGNRARNSASASHFVPPAGRNAGFTLVEVLVAAGLGSLVMAVVAALSIYSARTFSAMSNYVDLDMHSRNALDVIAREVRLSTAVVDCNTNSSSANYVTLTNSDAATLVKITWKPDAATLTLAKTGQPTQTLLVGCDRWKVWLYNRAPALSSTNISFNAATNLASCKLINMSWKCSRTIMGSKLNTESVQTAQIVLRNKVK